VNKFMLVLAVSMFLVTTFLLVNIAIVGQAPVSMYWFIGTVGYGAAIIQAIIASFVE